eukprot:gene14560-20601_t
MAEADSGANAFCQILSSRNQGAVEIAFLLALGSDRGKRGLVRRTPASDCAAAELANEIAASTHARLHRARGNIAAASRQDAASTQSRLQAAAGKLQRASQADSASKLKGSCAASNKPADCQRAAGRLQAIKQSRRLQASKQQLKIAASKQAGKIAASNQQRRICASKQAFTIGAASKAARLQQRAASRQDCSEHAKRHDCSRASSKIAVEQAARFERAIKQRGHSTLWPDWRSLQKGEDEEDAKLPVVMATVSCELMGRVPAALLLNTETATSAWAPTGEARSPPQSDPELGDKAEGFIEASRALSRAASLEAL